MKEKSKKMSKQLEKKSKPKNSVQKTRKTKSQLNLKPKDLELAKQIFSASYPNFEFSLDSLFKELITERAEKIGLVKKENPDVIHYAQVVMGISSLNDALEKFLAGQAKPFAIQQSTVFNSPVSQVITGQTPYQAPVDPAVQNEYRLDNLVAQLGPADDIDSLVEIEKAREEALNRL